MVMVVVIVATTLTSRQNVFASSSTTACCVGGLPRCRYNIPGKLPGGSSAVGAGADGEVAAVANIFDATTTSSTGHHAANGDVDGDGGDPSLAAFCNLTASFMAKTDLRVVNYIADDDCSPHCTDPMLAHDQVDAVIL